MSSQDNNKNQTLSAEEIDVQAKTLLVEKAILDLYKPDSNFQDLCEMHAAIKGGDSLSIKKLAGGVTNYSYKISLASGKKSLFAKICFEYALWNPDRTIKYDLTRVENEYKMMKTVGSYEPSPVVEPYACIDIVDDEGNKMKLLVTAWAVTDEQIANQWIDGEVDSRVIKKLTKVLATLNTTTDFDVHFNEDCRPCFASCFPIFPAVFESVLASDGNDKYIQYGRKMGVEKFKALIGKLNDSYMSQQVLCHGDPNVFNILVEPKPSIETLEAHGPTGDMVLCDWEMSYVGPLGKDIGWFQAFPVSAALAQAAQGHREEIAQKMFGQVELFWNEYEAILRAKGKDDEYLRQVYISSFGWNACLLACFYYLLGVHVDKLPVEDLAEQDKAVLKGSYGYIGLKLMEMAFSEDSPAATMSLAELKQFYKDLVMTEIAELSEAKTKQRTRPRRSSVLRTSGRRISDAGILEAAAFRASMELRGSKTLDLKHLDVLETFEEKKKSESV